MKSDIRTPSVTCEQHAGYSRVPFNENESIFLSIYTDAFVAVEGEKLCLN